MTIDDSCGTDLERMTSRPLVPLSACSSGTVTSDSTSVVESPVQIVCTSTCGGANSGNTSTRMFWIWRTPNTIMDTAAATTRKRKRRLELTMNRIRVRLPPPRFIYSPATPSSAPSSSCAPTVTTLTPGLGPDVSTTVSPSTRSTVTASRSKLRAPSTM